MLLHQSTEFKCIVNGNPLPSIKWFKDGNEVRADGVEVVLSSDHQTLSLLKPEAEDAGSYMCIASNEIGEESKAVNLDVLGKNCFLYDKVLVEFISVLSC